MKQYCQTILNKYGIRNVESKLREEIQEYIESGNDEELADILNVILTINIHRGGHILEIAQQKRNRTTLRMAADWYDERGMKPCANLRKQK